MRLVDGKSKSTSCMINSILTRFQSTLKYLEAILKKEGPHNLILRDYFEISGGISVFILYVHIITNLKILRKLGGGGYFRNKCPHTWIYFRGYFYNFGANCPVPSLTLSPDPDMNWQLVLLCTWLKCRCVTWFKQFICDKVPINHLCSWKCGVEFVLL